MVQMADEVPEGYGADGNEVPEGYGADSTQGCGGFGCRSLADEVSKDKVLEGSGWLMGFRKVPVQIASKVCGKFYGIMAESRQASALFWRRWLLRFRRVPVQIADEVPESFGADSCDEVLEGSGADC